MTMMISKFNQLIRSRVLWIVFLVVIVLTFVAWGMPSCSSGRLEGATSTAQGTLDGKEISQAEFNRAYEGAYIDVLVQFGPEALREEGFDRILRQRAWQRLAQLRKAEEWGLTASTAEIQQAIAANFANKDGSFNRDYYMGFYVQRLQPQRISLAQFEHFFGEMIILNKLRSAVVQQAVVSPLEIRQAFSTLQDTYAIDYATIESAPIDAALDITDEQSRATYDADPTAFDLPERRVASYVSFDPAAYAQPSQEFGDEELEDFYNDNIDLFSAASTNADGSAAAPAPIPFEEARESVVDAMRAAAANERMENAANEFATKTLPLRDGTIPVFADVAASLGYEVNTTAPFAANDAPVPVCGPAFPADAFARDLGPFDAVSDPIPGADTHLYVLHLDEIQAPRTPAYEEVAAEATARARAKALSEALSKQAADARASIEAALKEGTSFAEAATAAGLVATSPAPFTGLDAANPESPNADPVVAAISPALAACNPGELTEPIAVPAGLAIALLRERTPADEASFEAQKASIASLIRQRRAQDTWAAFLDELLAPERFTDNHPVDEADEEELSDEEVDGAAEAAETAEEEE